MKRYRLLKDLPYVKAGCVYFKDDSGNYLKGDKTSYIPNAIGWKHERFAIHSDYVENNPEWFEPIPDTPEQTKEGLWSDEDMVEFANQYHWSSTRITLDKFKASKQSRTPLFKNGVAVVDEETAKALRRLPQCKDGEKPLFTTEDGVDIFEGDEYFKVFDNLEISQYNSTKDGIYPPLYRKNCYSTKEAAEAYVAKQKISEKKFVTRICELVDNMESQSNTPVAIYHGRPEKTKEQFEEEVKEASKYYGGNLLCEECKEIGRHKKTCSNFQSTKPSEQPTKEKEWEIVEYFSGTQNKLIKKVKRLSDNEIFSVGDEVVTGLLTQKIDKFEIHPGGMFLCVNMTKDVSYKLNEVKKSPSNRPSEQPTKERIEITNITKTGIGFSNYNGTPYNVYEFRSFQTIPEEKFPLIKNQIEAVLNDETHLLAWAKYISPKEHQQKLDKAIEDAIQQCINVVENYYLDNPNCWQSGHLNNVCEKLEKLKTIKQ